MNSIIQEYLSQSVSDDYDVYDNQNTFNHNVDENMESKKSQTNLRVIKFQKIINPLIHQKDDINKQQTIIIKSKSPNSVRLRITNEAQAINTNLLEINRQKIHRSSTKTAQKIENLNQAYSTQLSRKQSFINNKQRPIFPNEKKVKSRPQSPVSKLNLTSPDFPLFEGINQMKEKYLEKDWEECCRILNRLVDEILKNKQNSVNLYKVRLTMVVNKLIEFLSILDDPLYLNLKLEIATYAMESIFFVNSDQQIVDQQHKLSASKYGFYPDLIIQLLNLKSCILKRMKYLQESLTYSKFSLELINYFKVTQEKHITLLNLCELYAEQKKQISFILLIDFFIQNQRYFYLVNQKKLNYFKSFQEAIQYGKECIQECENLVKSIEENQEKNTKSLESEPSQLQDVIKVQCICLFNMGIIAQNQQNYKLSLDHLKKSFEQIEQFNLTLELQNIYFDFKNKYLETKEKILDLERTNKMFNVQFQSSQLSPISPLVSFVQSNQNFFYKHFVYESQNISGSSSLGIKSILKQSNNQDQNIKENKDILEQQTVQFVKFNQKNIQTQVKSPNSTVRIIERKTSGIRFQSPQRQLLNISFQKLSPNSLSPPKNKINSFKLTENKSPQTTAFDTVQQVSIIQESSKKNGSDLEQSIQIAYPDTQKQQNEQKNKILLATNIPKFKQSPQRDQIEKNLAAKVKNTLKVLDQELKVKRADSIKNKIEIFPNHIVKDSKQHIQFQAKQKLPSRFSQKSSPIRQTNLDRLLNNHIQSQSKEDNRSFKLSQLKFENDLETIKINLSWSSNSDCDEREYNKDNQIIGKRENFLLDIDKRERLQFLYVISQEIEEKEFQKWQAEQQEKEKQSQLDEIKKKIKARQIVRNVFWLKSKLAENNLKRLIMERKKLKQEQIQKNFFYLKFYIVLMKYFSKQKQKRQLIQTQKKNIVQTFIKLQIKNHDDEFVTEDYFVKTVQFEGQDDSQRVKFYVTLISKRNAKDRFSSVFTSDDILMNLNLNRFKNQIQYTINNIRSSFITSVSPFIVIQNKQVIIDWTAQRNHNLEKMSQNNVKEDAFIFEESIQMCSKFINQNAANLINFVYRKNSFTGKFYNMLEKTIQIQNYFRRRICQQKLKVLLQQSKKRDNEIILKKGTYYEQIYFMSLIVSNLQFKKATLVKNTTKSY